MDGIILAQVQLRFTINMPSGRIEFGKTELLVICLVITAITALVCLITKKNVIRRIFTALMAMYLVVAASLTVFPIYIRCSDIAARFAESGWRLRDCISLVPFKTGFEVNADQIKEIVAGVTKDLGENAGEAIAEGKGLLDKIKGIFGK